MRIAILGAGLMGRWHAFTAKQLGAEIAAVIDIDTEAAFALSSRYGGQVCCDYEQSLLQVDFDVLHICTPLSTHAKFVEKALDAGKHVIVEKPLSEQVRQVAQLSEQAVTAGKLLCPIHQFAFQRGVAELKAELARRQVAPLCVSFDFASAGGSGRPAKELRQVLLEILPHPLSLLTEIWPGEILNTEGWTINSPSQGELIAQGEHGSFPIILKMSLHARPTHCKMTVYHAQGTAHLDLFHDFVVFESPAVSRFSKIARPFTLSGKTVYRAGVNLVRRMVRRQPAYPGLASLVSQCYMAIEQGTAAPISSENYIAVTRVCEYFGHQLPLVPDP